MAGNIFLVGLMGAGKTTVGRYLAKHLGKTFYDSDHEIERRTGVNIPLIFEVEGEEGFRKREASVIAELSQMHDIVLATGGGAVLREENRDNLQKNGLVIYLRANINELWQRTRNDKHRPLLQTASPRRTLEQFFAIRDPLYSQIATMVVDTGGQPVNVLAQHIEQLMMQLSALNPDQLLNQKKS